MPAVYIYRRSFKKMKIQQKSLFTALTNVEPVRYSGLRPQER
jgi:hypothetical protein